MKKILIPFDGSESAMHAVRHVADQMKDRSQAEVHLLHVVEPLNITTDPDYWKPDVQREHLNKGEQTVTRAKKVFEEIGMTPTCSVRMGWPHHDIAKYVRENGCTEIVMGTRGMSPAASFFVGSVATRVMQLVDCPVTLVK